MDLKEESILGARVGEHWYYRSKSAALRALIGSHLRGGNVLDVGAGAGFFARDLVTHGLTREVTCVDPGYFADRDEQLPGGVVRFRRSISSSDASLALFMDVLEHVDDDVGLLREYADILGPGRLMAITVPAFSWLWSDHDVFLEHRRRYSLRQLEDVVRRAGLVVVSSHYMYGAVLPAAAMVRMAGRLRRGERPPKSSLMQQRPSVNTLLTRVCLAETRVHRHNRAAGLTVMALCTTK